MELKVWVDGVVRVVCGLSLNTCCQDVVIALAQAIGRTGRYTLTLKLRATERQLVADDCPLQHLAQLGQLAAEVQFVLQRTGPSLSDGPDTPGLLPPSRPSDPEPVKRQAPHKALTFSLGPSTHPRRMKPNRAWSPSPRASPEPRASPVSFLDPVNPAPFSSSSASKEEVFRQVLQQQRRLQDLEIQLQALERETEAWELQRLSAAGPGLSPVFAEDLEELEEHLRQNEAELVYIEFWEEQLQAETDRERDMQRRLQQTRSSLDDLSRQMQELQTSSAHLQQDLNLRAHRQSCRAASQQNDELLRPLKLELHHRLQQGHELDATLSQTQTEIQAAEDQLQDRWQMMEELNKELRQCKLQQFIQQSGSPQAEATTSLQLSDVYLQNAGIME